LGRPLRIAPRRREAATDVSQARSRLDEAPEDVARHGFAEPRGQESVSELPRSRGGRFGRMFPSLPACDLSEDATGQLATALIELAGTSNDNVSVVAGYTYLGQFIDHDITFDPTSKLERANDPFALVDFRTPRFDLDSLYGSGPEDQPFLYDWTKSPPAESPPGVKLLVGRNPSDDRKAAQDDVPRNHQGRALIGDARNDENLIIAQLHLLFIRFHNRVVDSLLAGSHHSGKKELFEEAQRIVRWHYQWIVMRDFLPRIIGHDIGPFVRRPFIWCDEPFMPVEFSAAAFRFGHSMVREDYRLNDGPNVPLFQRDGANENLGGSRRLPASLQIEWPHFFKTTRTFAQKSKRIDPSLADALTHVPPIGAALARLNLRRGRALGLPSGPDVAQALGETPLTDDELLEPLDGHVNANEEAALRRATPLWYYVLREAELRGAGGLHLGPVGGRIVAEVLLGLLEADPSSYLRQRPQWTPELPRDDADTFTRADLVEFTLG
jgi:hypothetical protein